MSRVHKAGVAAILLILAVFAVSFDTASSSTPATPLEAAKTAKTDADTVLAAAQKADASAAATVAAIEAGTKEPPPKEEPPKEEPPSGTWRGFSASNPMPAGQQPFGPESFINQRVPVAPELTANSAGIVSFVGTPNAIWTDGGYDRPWYYASETDPVLEVAGVKYGAFANGLKLHVPANAKPAPAPC